MNYILKVLQIKQITKLQTNTILNITINKHSFYFSRTRTKLQTNTTLKIT